MSEKKFNIDVDAQADFITTAKNGTGNKETTKKTTTKKTTAKKAKLQYVEARPERKSEHVQLLLKPTTRNMLKKEVEEMNANGTKISFNEWVNYILEHHLGLN